MEPSDRNSSKGTRRGQKRKNNNEERNLNRDKGNGAPAEGAKDKTQPTKDVTFTEKTEKRLSVMMMLAHGRV